MANITKQRHGEILQKLFQLLQEHPNGLRARDAVAQVSSRLMLTEYEQGSYVSGGIRFDKIMRFATVDTVRAGWLIKDSGIWTITEAGIAALSKWPNPKDFYSEASRLYQAWRKECSLNSMEENEDEGVLDTSVSFEQAEDQARSDIEIYLGKMSPYDFQNLVGDLLKAMGYFIEWIAPPGKDGGVDIIAHVDPLGCQGPRIKVQVKRQQQSVSLPDLKSFVANVDQLDTGIFVCTGGFTKDAAEYARSHQSKRIMLINLDKLIKLWIEFTPKLKDRAWQRLPLTPIYFLTLQS